MEITVKETEPCKLLINYVADSEEVSSKRVEIIRHFKKAPVPGCRKGKASINAIKVHYRTQIEESLKRALAEDAYHNTIFEKKLRPHGTPKFNSLLMIDSNKFACEFEMSVKPDFNVTDFKAFEIPNPHSPMNVSEISEKMLQELRVRFGESVPYTENDFVQLTDNVIIDYEGFVDDTKVDNLCSQGEMLTVGHSQLVNFDENLLGMKMGETREFNITIPENGLPSFAGKSVHFKVNLTMGAKNTPCPLDDTLAQKLGKTNYPELKEFINKTANARLQESERLLKIDVIAHKLLDEHKFAVPNWLTLSEAQYLVQSAHLNWESLADVDKEKYMEMAEKNVKLSLILDKIRDEQSDAQLSDQEVFDIIKQNIMAKHDKANVNDIIKEMSKTGYLQILFARIKDEHTLDFVLKNVKIVD